LLGEAHPDVATSLSNLATLYQAQGRYDDAEPLYHQAITMYQQLLGEAHPDVATSLSNLATLYQAQERYSDAETLYRQALTMRQRLLGEAHPDVATSFDNFWSNKFYKYFDSRWVRNILPLKHFTRIWNRSKPMR